MENKIQNDDLLEKLGAVETVDELNKILAENGIALEEGITAEQFLATMKGEVSDELGEDDLDAVAGGVRITAAMIRAAAQLGLAIAIYIARYIRKRR